MSANDATMSAKGRCASSRAAAPKFAGPIPAYCLPHGPLLPNLPGRSRPSVSPIIEPRAPKGASAKIFRNFAKFANFQTDFLRKI